MGSSPILPTISRYNLMDKNYFISNKVLKLSKSGKLIASSRSENLCKKLKIHDEIVNKTLFLPKCKFSRRLYHIIHQLEFIPKCNNPNCDNDAIFKEFANGYQSYCSRSCLGVIKMNEYNTSDKYSESRKMRNEINSQFIKNNSDSDQFIKGRILGGINSMKKLDPHNNKYEVKVIKYLNDNKYNYVSNKRLYVNKFKYYKPDFYFPDLNLIIELDGSIHRHSERILVDNEKDSHYSLMNISVERIDVTDISTDELLNKVINILKRYGRG